MADIPVNNEELRTNREVVRELGALLRQLELGHLEKIVIMNRGKIGGIIVTPDHYAKLLEDQL